MRRPPVFFALVAVVLSTFVLVKAASADPADLVDQPSTTGVVCWNEYGPLPQESLPCPPGWTPYDPRSVHTEPAVVISIAEPAVVIRISARFTG